MSTSTAEQSMFFPGAAAATIFNVANARLGLSGVWKAPSWATDADDRQKLLNELKIWGQTEYPGDNVLGFVGAHANSVNRALRQAGFSIELAPFASEHSFGAVGISKVKVNWRFAGELTSINTGGVSYRAFKLNKGFRVIEAGNRQILEIVTKESLRVRLEETTAPTSALELLDYTRGLHGDTFGRANILDTPSAKIPIVTVDEQPSADLLIDSESPGHAGGWPWDIKQMVLQTIFSMNEVGAEANEAGAAEVRPRALGTSGWTTTDPFYLTIGYPQAPTPVFTGFIAQNHWRDDRVAV